VSRCKTAWCRQRIPRSLEQWSKCCTCSYWGNRSSVEGAAGRARRARVVLNLHREIRSRRRCNKDMEQWQNKCDVFAMPCPPTNLLCTRPNSGAHRCWCVCAPHVYWEPVAPVARSTVSASVDTRSESQKIMYNKTEISTRGINRRAPFLKPIQGCATFGCLPDGQASRPNYWAAHVRRALQAMLNLDSTRCAKGAAIRAPPCSCCVAHHLGKPFAPSVFMLPARFFSAFCFAICGCAIDTPPASCTRGAGTCGQPLAPCVFFPCL
jgi:hypothetical protein